MKKQNTSKMHSINWKNSYRDSGQMGFNDSNSSELNWETAADFSKIIVTVCFRFISHFIF